MPKKSNKSKVSLSSWVKKGAQGIQFLLKCMNKQGLAMPLPRMFLIFISPFLFPLWWVFFISQLYYKSNIFY